MLDLRLDPERRPGIFHFTRRQTAAANSPKHRANRSSRIPVNAFHPLLIVIVFPHLQNHQFQLSGHPSV
jgi:hypothetical protein